MVTLALRLQWTTRGHEWSKLYQTWLDVESMMAVLMLMHCLLGLDKCVIKNTLAFAICSRWCWCCVCPHGEKKLLWETLNYLVVFVLCAFIEVIKIMSLCVNRCSDAIEDENTQEGKAAGTYCKPSPKHALITQVGHL